MGLPPKVSRSNDFTLDIPNPGDVKLTKALTSDVTCAIFSLRATVLIKGSLADSLMTLHRSVNNETEIAAQYDAHVHPRLGKNARCRLPKKSDCVRFAVIKMIHLLQGFKKGLITDWQVTKQIAVVNAIAANQYENFRVSGNPKVGFTLVLKRDSGLTG